jgi:UDP-hydrolysing UDP-N-acetyl-D-glucosamine 2-epimerase
LRSIGVATTSRADYGANLPLLRAIQADPDLCLKLYVSGAHLSPEFGLTVQMIDRDGFPIEERVEMLLSADTPTAITKSVGLGLIGFSDAFSRSMPDILIVTGDRYEMLAVALAALPFKIPVAHLSGGELTEGAIDDSLRHCITKLSHLHFTTTEEYARRVIQLGEDPSRVFVTGEPTLDGARESANVSPTDLEQRFGVDVKRPFLVVTCHPVTLEYEQTEWQIGELLAALQAANLPVVFTMPNADTAGRIIATKMREWVRTNPGIFVENFGVQIYHSLMSYAAAIVGNSSSGIIESPTFKVPTVNIGKRQDGRVRARNVIDVGYPREEILAGIKRAISEDFRASLTSLVNPYASRTRSAASEIMSVLKTIQLGDWLIRKKFHDFGASPLRAGKG